MVNTTSTKWIAIAIALSFLAGSALTLCLNSAVQQGIEIKRIKVVRHLLFLSQSDPRTLSPREKEVQAVLRKHQVATIKILSSWMPKPLAASVELDDAKGSTIGMNETMDGKMLVIVLQHGSRLPPEQVARPR
jgi:hypothetical protein